MTNCAQSGFFRFGGKILDCQGFFNIDGAQALANGAELEVIDHSFKSRHTAGEIGVVAKPRKPAGIGNARLVRVYLPGVEVKNLRFALPKTGAFEQPARENIRILTEIAAARRWNSLPEHFGGGEREFRELGTLSCNDCIRFFRAAGNAVIVMMGGKDA